MTATPVSICSNALLQLGANPIASLDEGTDRALLAANLFGPVRDFVLRRHPWNCATKRVVLSPNATPPAFGWTFAFTLPPDYMRVVAVGESSDDGEGDDYTIESGSLLSDADPCYLRYIWRNENPATWDDALVWAVTTAMRAAFAYPTTASTSLEKLVEDALKDILKQARAVDGQDVPPQQLGDTPLTSSRFGGRQW